MSAAAARQGPEGFRRFRGARGFAGVLGPLWVRPDAEPTYAVLASAGACNGQGVVHGGFISTFADIALVHGAACGLPAQARFVTASLGIDFLDSCRAGEWLLCRPERVRMGARSGLACARLWTARTTVAFARAAIVRVASPADWVSR